MNDPVRILVKGMNWSGSGTVVDFMKEFRGVIQVPGGLQVNDPTGEMRLGEFNYFRLFGGVGDQIDVSHGRTHPSILNMEIKAITEMNTMKGRLKELFKALYHGKPINPGNDRKVLGQLRCIGNALRVLRDELEKDKTTEFRLGKAREWISMIASSLSREDTKALLFDQPVNIGQHDAFWPEVFKPYKLIIVMRNPKDQFSQMANHREYFSRHYRTAIAYLRDGWSYDDAVLYRVESKRNEMATIDKFLGHAKDTMLVSFEEMVLDYNRASTRIRDFVGLNQDDHLYPRRYFNPDISRKNIGVYLKNKQKVDDSMLADLIDWYNGHTGYLKVDELDELIRKD